MIVDIFLSTLSLRRATRKPLHISKYFYISIHALLAESDRRTFRNQQRCSNFYPRSPCGERPHRNRAPGHGTAYFYPRSPCGERPVRCQLIAPWWCISIHALLAESDGHRADIGSFGHVISIHALLAESDCRQPPRRSGYRHFYPRSPCGERPVQVVVKIGQRQFLSTLSLRRATCDTGRFRHDCGNFYPRSPCGERPVHQ